MFVFAVQSYFCEVLVLIDEACFCDESNRVWYLLFHDKIILLKYNFLLPYKVASPIDNLTIMLDTHLFIFQGS